MVINGGALKSVDYRSKNNPVTQHIAVRWVHGLPQKRDECWFLMSSLPAGAKNLTHLYGQRMTIEELFRDHKNKRNGWSLRDTQITKPDRIDRLLLILALAYQPVSKGLTTKTYLRFPTLQHGCMVPTRKDRAGLRG